MTASVDDLIKWPTSPDEATVDQMLRIIGAQALTVERAKMQLLSRVGPKDRTEQNELHHLACVAVISTVGMMKALKVLAGHDPELAHMVAVDHWEMCDAGDTVAEELWINLLTAGLDPELVPQPEQR